MDAHVEEYNRLSRVINRYINELSSGASIGNSGRSNVAPSTLSRTLVQGELELAEAEGQVRNH